MIPKHDDPLETAFVIAAAGAVGAILGFFVGVAVVVTLALWCLS